MRTAELTGALLDYWAARAAGIPARDLTFAGDACVRLIGSRVVPVGFSKDWRWCGPLIGKWKHHPMMDGTNWNCIILCPNPQEAICRAVVRAVFGDDVPNVLQIAPTKDE